MKIILTLVLSFISLQTHAFYLKCTTTDLTVSIQDTDYKKALISYLGRDYHSKGKLTGSLLSYKFSELDRGQKMEVTFLELALRSGSGIVSVRVNGEREECRFAKFEFED